MADASQLPLVSVLFITYQRVALLRRAIESFRVHTDYPKLELVIADDGSDAAAQAEIRTLGADIFALSARNRGLGANNNSGMRACQGDYILMLQDDWLCHGPPGYLADCVRVMQANPNVGLINFAGARHPPDSSRPLSGARQPCFVTPAPLDDGTKQYFLYSDQPHLMTRQAFQQVGFYREDRDMEKCERDYERRWAAQAGFATAVFPAYHLSVFRNVESAPSFRRNLFRNRLLGSFRPMAGLLKARCRPLYLLGKVSVRASIRTLELLRIVR